MLETIKVLRLGQNVDFLFLVFTSKLIGIFPPKRIFSVISSYIVRSNKTNYTFNSVISIICKALMVILVNLFRIYYRNCRNCNVINLSFISSGNIKIQ